MVTAIHYDPDYVPVRGDVVWIDFNPQAGDEIPKRRPALVLSAYTFNYYQKAAVICPITRTARASRFDVVVPEGFAVHGTIRVDQVKCLDWRARKAVFESKMPDGMPDEIVNEVSVIVEAVIWGE